MAKKYSSLRSLASGSGTPYGVKKDNTSNSNTFNLPSVIETIPSSKSRGGKSIHDYVSRAATSSSLGPCTSAKHITISGGEYRRGSFDIGSNSKDSFRDGDKYPSAIYVNKYVAASGFSGIDPNYNSVDSIEDLGGTYVNSAGTTVNYTLTYGATLLTGNEVDNPNTTSETLVLVYSGGDLAPYAGKRTIKVNFSDGTSVTFPDVVIPGWKNNTGIGESLTAWTPQSTATQMMVASCSNDNTSTTSAHSHLNNINNDASPLFVYPNEMYNLTVTNLGTHHDNTGLWNEGFQPDDNLTGGSSLATNAHQETWPLGLFYNLPATEAGWGIITTGLSVYDNLTVSQMWDAQYNGSELTNISTTANERGNPLKADSVQHYKLIQGQILRQAALTPTRGFITQWQSTQNEYFMGNLSGLTNTNTADDGGSWYAQIETEMMAGIGSIWHDSSLTYSTHEGGATDGLIGNPGNTKVTPSFQSVQIYTESIQCASCNPVTTGSIPIDMCTNPNSPSYYLYTGVDCKGAAIPVGLMNGTETWGPNGSTGYTYELVASSVCTSCGCSGVLSVYNPSASSAVPVPDFSFANINAPTTQGGNDGWADIEIDPAFSGNEGWVYLVEPLANTSAGLGVGAVDSISAVSSSSGLTVNGVHTFSYTSGSTSGESLVLEFIISNYNTSPVFTLKQFQNRGKGFVPGEIITLTDQSGATITLTVNSVTGVPVLIQGTANHVHYSTTNCTNQGQNTIPTASLGLIATIGTDVFLQHTGTANDTNNYGSRQLNNQSLPNTPGLPFKNASLFGSYPFDNSEENNYTITGMEAGSYKVTVIENNYCIAEESGCFTQQVLVIPPGVSSTNGCTDNNSGTNDGSALNYDANATVDDDSCIYCRAADGKLVDFQSNELTVSGSNEPGDIFTSTNNSTTVASTTSVATDGSIAYTRTLNSIMNYYTGQIVDANGTANAEFKMELYSCTSSTQTLTGASQVGATVTTLTSVGFNYDFDSINWSQGLTYGYYAIKSYVDDPYSASEQEQCFQVDYFIVPVLACITGLPGMQVGITTDNVTITDLDLVVASIPGNNLNPCSTQCCDDPTAIVGYAQNNSIPGCADPYFNVLQTCPAGNLDYVTTVTAEIQKLINGVWTTVTSNVNSAPTFAPGTTIFGATYVIFVYWQYGPGDYRVNHILDYTWPNGTTSQCESHTNVINLNSPICGCTDPNSLNFNPLATIDDGSCTYCVDGCMDPDALNYNSLATCPAPCTFCIYGCMDPAANNYNSAATCDDGSCQYGVGCGCTDILADNYGEDCGGNIVGYPPPCDDGCCSYGGAFCANPPLIDNLTTIEATCLPDCNTINVFGCTDPTAYNYNSMATIDDGTCCFIAGCMDPTASNYNSNACHNDSSCIPWVYGCTDPSACNYDPLATQDDGTCEWTSCVGPCIGTTTINDDGFEAYLENTPCHNYCCNNPLGYNMGDGTVGNNTVLNQNICECAYMTNIPYADCDKGGNNGGNLTGCINDHLEGISAFPKLKYFGMNNGFIGSNGQTVDFSSNLLLEKLILDWQEVHALNLTGLTALYQLQLQGQGFDVTFSNPPYSSTGTLLTSLDLSTNTALYTLDARDNNALSSVTLPSTSTLNNIELSWGNLTSLDVTNNTGLEILKASAQGDTYVTGGQSTTGLSSINLTNNINLERLELSANKLTSIDLSTNVKLKVCVLSANQLTSLDVTNNPDLANLQIKYNSISSIDLSNNTNLRYFWAIDNNLTTLDFTGLDKLVEIIAPNNSITSVSGLGSSNLCTTIKEINMADNNITGTLDLKGMGDGVTPTPAGAATLEIDLRNNDITVLDLGSNFPIPIPGPTSGPYSQPWNCLKLQGNNNLVSVKVGTAARVLEAQAIAAIGPSTWSAYNFIP